MRIKNKFKFIRSMFILVLLVLAISHISIAKTNTTEAETITYTITKSDTLWTIAKQYTPNNKDIRQTIFDIEKLNNLKNATIYPGQEIQIKIGQ